MGNKLEEMFAEYLRDYCICMGYFSSRESFLNGLYVDYGITPEEIERNLYSVYIEDGKYYVPKQDLRRAMALEQV